MTERTNINFEELHYKPYVIVLSRRKDVSAAFGQTTPLGFSALVVSDVKKAEALIPNHSPDLVVLDSDDFEVSSFDQSIFRRSPYLVLSSDRKEKACYFALERGAQDFVKKPFCIEEAAARIKAIVRRTSGEIELCKPNVVLTDGSLVVDYLNRKIFQDGTMASLTRSESRLLYALVLNRGKLVRYGELEVKAFGPHNVDQNAYLRTFLSRLRSKFESLNAASYIETIRGIGVVFDKGNRLEIGQNGVVAPET